MLKNTFQHIVGFGPLKETSLWNSGITCWEDYDEQTNYQLEMFESRNGYKLLAESFQAFENKDADFFARMLPPSEFYRIALSFPDDVMFLDIETTGLSRYYDQITLIGWSFLDKYQVYYKGLKTDTLFDAFRKAKCIVTFNGSLFDLPFIKKEFPDVDMPLCHIDLRFFARRFGYSGGQKRIEKEINFRRSQSAQNLTGEIAPVLWHKYKEGDIKALKKLIAYNMFDVEGMKALLDVCIKRSVSEVPEHVTPRSVFRFSKFRSKVKFSTTQDLDSIPIVRYEGKTGPTITLKELPEYKNLSIVGIDLTGSEARATGWCHLVYDKAVTRRIDSDAEIIAETLKANPDIVSIDSPLSLPVGRTSVFDDDPGRKAFGIMRLCERILKGRGVSVYPSLIPSMQKLTQRGINLANEFRKMGIPVIESYPGAAQDILGIPRKRASLEFLVKGMSAFGIKGNYTKSQVSHDELDAITSAMLGYFYWCGKFEALGNEEEDYLIIPDTEKSFPGWEGTKVVGFSGGLATGKTTAAKYLESNGFSYGRFSMVLAQLVEAEGKNPTRQSLQEMGDYVNRVKGQRWLCKTLIREFFHDQKLIVIDGLRFPEDHAFMKEHFGPNFTHVHMKCNDSIRKFRYEELERNDVPFEDAVKHSVERSVDELSNLADVIIVNDNSFESLYIQLDKLLQNNSVCQYQLSSADNLDQKEKER